MPTPHHLTSDTAYRPDRLLTLSEVSDLTSLSRATVYRLIEVDRYPSPVKIGRNSRWPASEVDAFI